MARVKEKTCDYCAQRINAALQDLPGVVSVKAERVSAQVHVTFDTEATRIAQLGAAVSEAGFESLAGGV